MGVLGTRLKRKKIKAQNIVGQANKIFHLLFPCHSYPFIYIIVNIFLLLPQFSRKQCLIKHNATQWFAAFHRDAAVEPGVSGFRCWSTIGVFPTYTQASGLSDTAIRRLLTTVAAPHSHTV